MLTEKPSLTGKYFRLKSETVAVDTSGSNSIAVTMFTDEIIEVIMDPFPTDTRMVGVRWKGKALVMFSEDVEERGEEIRVPGA